MYKTGFAENEDQPRTDTQTKALLSTELFAHLYRPPNFCFPALILSMKTNLAWMEWKPSSFSEDGTPSHKLKTQIGMEAKQQGIVGLFRAMCLQRPFPG